MKKIFLALSLIAFMSSCTSTSNSTNSNTIVNAINVANTVSEINNLVNTMNLTPSQASVIGTTLSNYVSQYNNLAGLNTGSQEYKAQLKKYKSNALSSISSSMSGTEYSQFTNALITIANSANTNLSNGTINVLSSLVN